METGQWPDRSARPNVGCRLLPFHCSLPSRVNIGDTERMQCTGDKVLLFREGGERGEVGHHLTLNTHRLTHPCTTLWAPEGDCPLSHITFDEHILSLHHFRIMWKKLWFYFHQNKGINLNYCVPSEDLETTLIFFFFPGRYKENNNNLIYTSKDFGGILVLLCFILIDLFKEPSRRNGEARVENWNRKCTFFFPLFDTIKYLKLLKLISYLFI